MKLVFTQVLLLVISFNGAFCQTKGIMNKNYIDTIQTAEQIENLLIKIGGKNYETFKVNQTLQFENEECKKNSR
ncbi:MAG: hypothetical protein WDM90_18335 [Ferruginibacter sp.]